MGGKDEHHQETTELKVDQQNHPGCMWSILHVLKYHRWRYVRKKIPNKRTRNETPGSASHPPHPSQSVEYKDVGHTVEEKPSKPGGNKPSVKARFKALVTEDKHKEHSGNDSHPPNTPKSVEHKDAKTGHAVEEKASKSSGNKLKARIKALITEDMRKKKGKHHRSASVPHFDHHEEPVDGDPLAGVIFTKGSNISEEAKDPGKHRNQQTGNDSNDSAVEEKLDIAKQTLAEQKVENDEELKASESKEPLEALNIINLNKESLMKLLQNQSASMVHQIRKSDSFSSADPSRRGESGLLKFRSMKESLPKASEYKNDGLFKRSRSVMIGYADNSNSSPGVVQFLKSSGEAQPMSSVSRFKSLKNKIKQVLEQSRNEKQRITMDAILHRVPPGNKFSKETKKEVSEQLKNPVLSGDSKYSPKSSPASRSPHIRRTSSLSGSMSRYCQLYEATSKEINNQEPEKERPKSRRREVSPPPKTSRKHLARIHSLPDLYYFSHQNEDYSKALIKTASDSSEIAKLGLDEGKGVEDNAEESRVQDIAVEAAEVTSDASNDDNAEKGLHIDDSGGLVTEAVASQLEVDIVPRGTSSPKLEELSSVSKPELGLEEDIETTARDLGLVHLPPKEMEPSLDFQHKPIIDTPKAPETPIREIIVDTLKAHEKSIDTPKAPETLIREIIDIPRLRVEENIKAEFQYVKDVLELSGFSGTEALGEWHADDQPLDPCMYDEVEGYLVLEPDCCGNEGANSLQLALFDVVNEMLMEIYGRSCSYVPRRLSSLCHIRPLPRGHHVLEDVWEEIRWFLNFKPEPDQPVDRVVARDLARTEGWMSLQYDSECVGLELESLIFDDLLDEAIWE